MGPRTAASPAIINEGRMAFAIMEDNARKTIVDEANKAARALKNRLVGEDRRDYLIVEDLLQMTDSELSRVASFARMASLFIESKGLFDEFNRFASEKANQAGKPEGAKKEEA